MWLVWPTPYEYTRKAPNVWRVNRFSGIQEISTSKGWRTESEVTAEADARAAVQEAALAKKNAVLKADEEKLAVPRSLNSCDLGGAEASCSIAYRDDYLFYTISLQLDGALKLAWTSENRGPYYVVAKFVDQNGLEIISERSTLSEFAQRYEGPGKPPKHISLSKKMLLGEKDFRGISSWSPEWNWR
jgi:hypothetical protein